MTALVEYIKQDITTVTRGIVAHGCNTRGVMGAGAAKAIRRRWPSVYYNYKALCEVTKSADLIGQVQFVCIYDEELIVANCFTQENYGPPPTVYAKVDAVAMSLIETAKRAVELGLPLFMVKIGCERGGLSWDVDVQPIVEVISEEYHLPIFVCEV